MQQHASIGAEHGEATHVAARSGFTAAGRRVAKTIGAAVLPASMVVWRGPKAPHARGPGRAGRMALTFDDGPTGLTEGYLEVLARFDARATFFVIGEFCERRPDLVMKITEAGHEVAGHGYTHRSFPSLSVAELDNELRRTAALLPSSADRRLLVRPPRGAVSPRSMFVCTRAGFTTALWSFDSCDWRTNRADEVVAAFGDEEASKSGAIVLLHEGQSWTLEALPLILGKLGKDHHELVTVGELLHG